MNLLTQTISSIKVPDEALSSSVHAALSAHTDGAFGRLGDALVRYIRITGERHPSAPRTRVIISCADHGVAAESVSAYPPETTLNMMCNYLIAHGGAANAVANYADAQLVVADLGVNADSTDIPHLLHHSIARGTANMTAGAAMTRAQAVQAIETGIVLAQTWADAGGRCILPGEMGISNTTSSAAIVAALLSLAPEEVTGRGANISDARLAHKIEIVRRALSVNAPDPHDGLDVLAKVGGFELGCIAGLILGASARRMLVILDGANTTSAALIAHALAPSCTHYLLASHASLTEHSQPHALRRLGLSPMLRLDIRLSEAAGSSIALSMLHQMLRVWETIDSPRPRASVFAPIIAETKSYETANEASPLDQGAMDACQYRLDNLAKPIHSLGYLEQIAVRLAGITGCERPSLDLGAALLLVTDADGIPAPIASILTAMASHTGLSPHHLPCLSLAEGSTYAIGYTAAQKNARTHPILILGMAADAADTGRCISLLHGALTGAAAAGRLILPGDEQTDCIARKFAAAHPDIAPHILHILPDMLTPDAPLPAGMAGILGCDIIRAALHVLNDMKTFAETGVAVAIDGVGAGRQVRT